MLAATRFSYVTHCENVDGGLTASLAFFAALEAQATQIAEFQPAFIPGSSRPLELLTLHGGPVTSGASAVDVETLIATRIKRQQILYQPDKRIDIVIGETTLHDPPGTIETLVGQLDRLVAVSGLPAVHLAVLRTGTPMPILDAITGQPDRILSMSEVACTDVRSRLHSWVGDRCRDAGLSPTTD